MRSERGSYQFRDDYDGNWSINWSADSVDDGWMFGIDSVVYHGRYDKGGEVQHKLLPEHLAVALLDHMIFDCLGKFADERCVPWTSVRDFTRGK